MGVGMMERNLCSSLQCLRGTHYILDPSKVLKVVTEMCSASKNSKSKRMDKILYFGYISDCRHY